MTSACIVAIRYADAQAVREAIHHYGPGFTVVLAGHEISLTPWGSRDGYGVRVRSGTRGYDIAGGTGAPDLDPATGVFRPAKDVRENTRVVNGFLLVGDRGPGNGPRSMSVSILAIRHGELVLLGDVAGRSADDVLRTDLSDPPGQMRFIDRDNQLNFTSLTSRGASPAVEIALVERSGQIVYDPKPCWNLNRDRYEREKINLTERPTNIASALEIAVIDQYCGRREALQSDFTSAARLFSPATYREFVREVMSVKAGERMEFRS